MSQLLDNLPKIRHFQAVAEAGSFHGAARRLNLAQPSISQSVATLEQAVGHRLLKRSHRGIELTPSGEVFLRYVRQVMAATRSVEVQLAAANSAGSGLLRVGIFESTAIYIWPEVLKLIKKEMPDLQVSLTTGRSGQLMELLGDNVLDLALTFEPREDPEFVIKTLYSDAFAFYVKKSLVPALFPEPNNRVSVAAFQQQNLLLFHSARIGAEKTLMDIVREHGVKDEQLTLVESFEVAKEFCAQGLGIALLPNRVAAQLVERHQLDRITIKGIPDREFGRHRLCYCYSPENPALKLIRNLIQLVRRVTVT